MTWYRHGSMWRTRPADEVLQIGDYFITVTRGRCHLHLVKVDGIADCSPHGFISLDAAKGYAKGLQKYEAC